MTSPSDQGLQAERTGLAWSRTSLGVAANAALLAYHQLASGPTAATTVTAGLAVLLAAGTALYGRHRTRALRHALLPRPLAATRAIPLLGVAVALLAVLTALVTVR